MTKAFLRKCWIALSSACLLGTALNYLLDTANATIINEAAAWQDGRRTTLSQPLTTFHLFNSRSNKYVAAFLHYLTLAKKAEAFSLIPIRYPWESTKTAPFDATNLDRQFIVFDGFKGLKKYPNTNYYKEVLRECGYFNTYIQKNP